MRICNASPRGGDGSLHCALARGHMGNHEAANGVRFRRHTKKPRAIGSAMPAMARVRTTAEEGDLIQRYSQATRRTASSLYRATALRRAALTVALVDGYGVTIRDDKVPRGERRRRYRGAP